MTDKELEQLVETQLLLYKKETVEAPRAFQADPNAVTFRNAENIPDELAGKSLDSIIGTLLRETSSQFRAVPSKKWVNHGLRKSRIRLKHGKVQNIALDCFLPERRKKTRTPRAEADTRAGRNGLFPVRRQAGGNSACVSCPG